MNKVILSYMYSPPRCSEAGTGWCRRGRGWRWWCGRSWQGWEPTGNPGSQRPAALKPTPKEWEKRKGRKTNVIGFTCSWWNTFPAVNRDRHTHSHTLTHWKHCYVLLIVYWEQYPFTSQQLANNPTLRESTWTAWVLSLWWWESPEVKTKSFVK